MAYVNDINYEFLVENALRKVVKDALKIVEVQGFPADHHFYIAFRTDYPGTELSVLLKSQYPEEMTIVIQHQFSNLVVAEDFFSIELHFGGIPQKLKVPYDAIVYFADPSVKFGLSFNHQDDDLDAHIGETPTERKVSNEPAAVISIDDFKKKKK